MLELLTKENLYEIHLSTVEILERVGVRIMEPRAFQILARTGAEVNPKEKIARIPEYLIKEAVKKAPSSFTLYGRDLKHKMRLGGERVYFSMQGTGVYVLDIETGQRRDSTLKDLENFFRLADALENIHHASITVEARDIPSTVSHVYELYAGFKNTSKTIDGYNYGETAAMDTIKMASIVAGGEEEIMKKPMLLGFYNPLSPLQHSKELLEGLMVYAKYKQPIIIAPQCQAGATAPVTLAGLLVQQNAEILSGIVICEFTNAGSPVLYGTVSTVMDMRTGNIALGAIEAGLINVATAQLARFYGLPCRGFGGTTDSKASDIQAGFEKAFTLIMAAMAGVNFVYDAAGALESTITASYEQAVIDNEMCGMVMRALRGIQINDKTLSLDVINEVGQGGQYLTKRNTLEFLKKEHYIPTILNRHRWKEVVPKDIREAAREKVKKILKEHQPKPLEKDIKEELEKFIRKVEKRIPKLKG